MKILHINLVQVWFKRHLEDKPEDYREITPYYVVRLMEWSDGRRVSKRYAEWIAKDLRVGLDVANLLFRKFDVCEAKNGYSATAPMWRKTHNETTTGIGNPLWGAPSHPVFIIKLGAVLEIKNCENLYV